MSHPSTPGAYFSANAWDEHSRKHPILAWFERYTKEFFDERLWTDDKHIHKWHTSDFTFAGPDGVSHHGIEKAYEAIRQMFGPFTAQLHSPTCAAVVPLDGEGKQGTKRWLMLGYADAYFNLAKVDGEARAVGEKVKSPDGREWDLVAPSAYKFYFVEGTEEGNGGIALSETDVFADTHPLMMMFSEMQAQHGK